MSAAVLLVSCRLGNWRLAIDANSLAKIDRGGHTLHFAEGSVVSVDEIDAVWECLSSAVLPMPHPHKGVKGWVACRSEILLLVESSFFLDAHPTEPPPAPERTQFVANLFGKLLVFRTKATQHRMSGALSIRQALEVVPATPLTSFEENPHRFREALFWRGNAVPIADWPLFLSMEAWRPADSSHFLVARTLRQRLLALPVQAPIQTEAADSAVADHESKPALGVLGWYTMPCGPVALLDLDAIVDC